MVNSSSSQSDVAPRIWAVTAVPLVLLLLAAVLLWVQVLRTNESSDWVEHSEEALALCSSIERQMHREHTARLQVWLQAERAEAAAEDAHTALRTVLDAAQTHIADNASQLERLTLVRGRYQEWERMTRGAPGVAPTGPYMTRMISASNTLLGSMLDALAELEREERQLRSLRVHRFEEVKSVWVYGALPLLLAVALLIAFNARRQLLRVVREFNQAFAGQSEVSERLEMKRWVRDVLRGLAVKRGESELSALGQRLLRDVASASGASVGALYTKLDGGRFRLLAGYGLSEHAPLEIEEGVGVAGAAVGELKPMLISGLSSAQLRIESAIVSAHVATAALIPCHHSDRVLGLMELGFLGNVSVRTTQLIDLLGETVGTSLVIVEDQERVKGLLIESRIQAEALQSQQEELRATNEELAAQTEAAKVAHTLLEERRQLLETVNEELIRQRDALARAQQALQQRAVDLGRADRYKSEFLASMSHELRTPLNSILILADALGENKSGNLTSQQVKFAETIGSSGKDLLTLINDVLDLSKIEAGAMEFEHTDVSIEEIVRPVIRIMEPLARERGLQLVTPAEFPDQRLRTDVRRAQQILKNLLSNACKFTPAGRVSLTLEVDSGSVKFSVEDTGIGIAAEDTEVIFEAFRQGEGAPNRRFSGTGLGLSISRDLARKLEGDVVVQSEFGKGSRFTLVLPIAPTLEVEAAPENAAVASKPAIEAPEGASSVPGFEAPVVLLITDNTDLIQFVSEAVRAIPFECVAADSAAASVALAESTRAEAIVLDLGLRSASGERVLQALREASATAQVPYHVLNSRPGMPLPAGAIHYLEQWDCGMLVTALMNQRVLPESVRSAVVVGNDTECDTSIVSALGQSGIQAYLAENAVEVLSISETRHFDCVVSALELTDMSGIDLVNTLVSRDQSPQTLVLHAPYALDSEQDSQLRRLSKALVVGAPRSVSSIVDEITIFLETLKSRLPARPISAPPPAVTDTEPFHGRSILLVDDDVRNVFALTSVLEGIGIRVVVARNGADAVAIAARRDDLALVLMDLMMPEMDGLEATRRIRKLEGRVSRVPIIALTAKAMSNDRDACLESGASEYIAKPVDTERLVSLMRIWLQGTSA